MRPDDVRLERAQVEPDDPLVVGFRIRLDLRVRRQQVLMRAHQRHQIVATGRPQVSRHALVSGEHRGGCAELGAHVRDRRLAGRADAARARSYVFHDRVGAAGHRELARDVEDHVLGRGPAAELAGQINGDVSRIEHLPRQAGDHLDRVGTADADRTCTEAARIRGVRIGADDQLARKRVILQHDLVNDPGARLPEAASVLGRGRAQEVVDLAAFVERRPQVGSAVGAGLDEMVAMYGGRHRDPVALRLHELQHAALAEHVLENHAVRPNRQIAAARLQILFFGRVEMPEEHLVGQRQRPLQPAADHREVSPHRLVELRNRFRRVLDRNHGLAPALSRIT